MMSEPIYIEEIEEYEEYYEEEIISYYDTCLSTIEEGDEESCTSHHSDSPPRKGPQSPRTVPEHIDLSPRGRRGSFEYSSHVLALVSPTLFSPMAEARKLKFSSFKSPLVGGRNRSNPSPGGRNGRSLPIPGMPLVLTNLETGEELIMDGDDDEYTLVSCNDSESMIGSLMNLDSISNFDERASSDALPLLDSLDHDVSPIPASKPKVASINGTTTSLHQQSHPQPEQMDFEGTKVRLENALQRRLKKGKIGAERMDYVRRKLRYDLNRRMFKEQLSQCVIPAQRRTEK